MGLKLARPLLKLHTRATAHVYRDVLTTFLRGEELGVARQEKKLPARRRNPEDESLLIRSAESLGRVIGSLQRQLDAARRFVDPAADERRTNGHAPARQRSGVSQERRRGVAVDSQERRQGVPVDGAKPPVKAKPAAKNKTTSGRKRSAASGLASKKR
jgi:hypothetical protein